MVYKIMTNYIVYELQGENGSPIYVGLTNNLRRRINEHRKSKTGFCLKNNMTFHGHRIIEEVENKKEGIKRESLYHDFYKHLGFSIAGQSGYKRSEEVKRIMIMATKDIIKEYQQKRRIKVIDSNGIVYESIRDCASKINRTEAAVSIAISGKVKKCAGLELKRYQI